MKIWHGFPLYVEVEEQASEKADNAEHEECYPKKL
jgi:hypothetical protein